MHAFDRQTDGQTEISSSDRVCIACSAVKIKRWTFFGTQCMEVLELTAVILRLIALRLMLLMLLLLLLSLVSFANRISAIPASRADST